MTTHVAPFTIAPANLTEAMEFSRMIANSSFCPSQMKGKPGDVILALQMGAEIGLSPMQAIQNISVINGRPCLWGDGLIAVAMSSPNYVSHREWEEGSLQDGTLIAYCGVTRKNAEEHIRSFSIEEAKKAGLWGKAGPWTNYPARMLQMRARGFAIRDKFADSLRGIQSAEEVSDYQVIESKPRQQQPAAQLASPTPSTPIEMPDISQYVDMINDTESLDQLKSVYLDAMRVFKGCKDELVQLVDAKDRKKSDLEAAPTEAELVANPANPANPEVDQAAIDEFRAELDEAEKAKS